MSAAQAEVLFANDVYYTAFADGDVEAMNDIWAHATPVTCLHPGGPVIEGRDAILDSWREILTSGQTLDFVCHDAKAHVVGDLAWVTCLEVIGDGALAATNIFTRENDSWKIVHHQAGPTRAQPQRNGDTDTPTGRMH